MPRLQCTRPCGACQPRWRSYVHTDTKRQHTRPTRNVQMLWHQPPGRAVFHSTRRWDSPAPGGRSPGISRSCTCAPAAACAQAVAGCGGSSWRTASTNGRICLHQIKWWRPRRRCGGEDGWNRRKERCRRHASMARVVGSLLALAPDELKESGPRVHERLRRAWRAIGKA